MRAICFAVFLCCGVLSETAWAYERIVSPDHLFEAYTTSNNLDGTGMKLFVRRYGGSEPGVLLASNDRWLDARWSPNSRFLAVSNHFDGHMNDVYVFGLGDPADSSTPKVALYAHSPNLDTYDVQWEVVGWRMRHREVLLKRPAKFQHLASRVRLRFGGRSLPPTAWPLPHGRG